MVLLKLVTCYLLKGSMQEGHNFIFLIIYIHRDFTYNDHVNKQILICKGPSKNGNNFTSVQNKHVRGGGGGDLWKSIFLPYTFNFCAWFLLFSWGFLPLKKCWSVLFFFGGGGGLRKCGLYTHEKVDIYERPFK